MILVDPANWPWRDRRWAHLVSDRSTEELHDFACSIGLRRMAFQGDHYDVDSVMRSTAVAAGAVEVPARELATRLRAAGLRRQGPTSAWKWQRTGAWMLADLEASPYRWRSGPGAALASLVARSVANDLVERVAIHAPSLVATGDVSVEVVVLERVSEVAVALFDVDVPGPPIADIVVDRVPVDGLHRG